MMDALQWIVLDSSILEVLSLACYIKNFWYNTNASTDYKGAASSSSSAYASRLSDTNGDDDEDEDDAYGDEDYEYEDDDDDDDDYDAAYAQDSGPG